MKTTILKRGVISTETGKYSYNGWPSVLTKSDGSLICAWSGKRTAHVDPFGKVVASQSTDGGYTWGENYIAPNTPLDDRDAGLTQSGDTIYLTSFNNSRKQQEIYASWSNKTPEVLQPYWDYLSSVSDEQEKRFLGPTLSLSTDGGFTFSTPVVMPITCPHGVMKKQDGSLLMIGRAFKDSATASFDYLPEGIYAMDIAPDGTQSTPRLIVQPIEDYLTCEPHAIDLGDKILLGLRVEKQGVFTIYHSYSYNGGQTFTKPVPTGYDGSPPHYLLHSSGLVVLTYARRKAPFPHIARISTDGGITFGEEIVLCDSAPDSDIGYPCTAENSDGDLVTVFYKKGTPNQLNSIEYVIWRIEK